MTGLWAIALLICFGIGAGAQEQQSLIHGIPAELYYLMPAFGDGTAYLRGQAPARGRMNICAVDQSLRFLDKDGKELEAGQGIEIVKVRIDSVTFLRYRDAFYRLYPLTDEIGVALRREVRILYDAKEGAYGTVSQTTSVQEYGIIYADGIAHELHPEKVRPHTVSDLFYFYQGGEVYPFTRKGLRRVFPERKDEIEAYFKSGHAEPKSADEALALLARWAL